MRLPPCSGLLPPEIQHNAFTAKCRHGFNSSPVCHGISAESVLPECCREEWCGMLYERTGGKPQIRNLGETK